MAELRVAARGGVDAGGLDATPLPAELALGTRRVTLVSGVLSVWGRTPATQAMTAATLCRLARGRYALGSAPAPGRWRRASTTSPSSARPTGCER